MASSVSHRMDSYVQLVTLLVIFLFVLFITWGVTRWIARYQSGITKNTNFEILDTYRIANNKFLQLVRVGRKYLVVAVCKDTVTMITELSEEDIVSDSTDAPQSLEFGKILERFTNHKNQKNLQKEDGRDE